MKKDWMIKESELDDDQITVLMGTLKKSCIVAGCAGSGKSLLALIKAQRIQKECGDDYKVIVFTKALCQYMNVGRKALGLHNDFDYHYDWIKQGCPSADYIIVDEIQDFDKEEISVFIKAARKNFYFFGDTAQSIYDGYKIYGKPYPQNTIPVDDIKSEMNLPSSKVKNFELFRNYRLPIPVARVAHPIGIEFDPFEESIYQSKENKMPKFIEYENKDEQLKAIHRIIKDQNFEDVAILVPNGKSVMEIYERLSGFGGNFEMKGLNNYTLNFSSTNPKIMTYHSAKGLQFETVFLPYIEDFRVEGYNGVSNRKALYVAMTRTYKYLYLMYSDNLPYPISEIDSDLYEETEYETVEDL